MTIKKLKAEIEDLLTSIALEKGLHEEIRPAKENQIQRDYWMDVKEKHFVLIEIERRPDGEILIINKSLSPEEGCSLESYLIYLESDWPFRAPVFLEEVMGLKS